MLTIAVCVSTAQAVPAKPGPRKYTQPDGTEITVTVRGDEFGHMIFSEEGLLLKENDGRLEYAAFGEDGIPYASGIAADGKGLPESVAITLQSPAQIEAWAGKMAQTRHEIMERRRQLTYTHTINRETRTRSDDEGNRGIVPPQNYGRFHTLFPTTGKQNVLVILVEYQDLGFTYGSHDYFDRMLNEEGFSDLGTRGSVRDWLLENSGGKFDPHFDVYGPVTLPKKKTYYGADTFTGMDVRAYEMATHAMQILDDEIDFSTYDGNGDGLIDNVYIIYAGPGDVGGDAVWPHQAFMSDYNCPDYFFDDVQLVQYACACEHTYDATRQDGPGTFVHEFSHVLGLPDIYGKGIGGMLSFTPGEWSIVDSGAYNNDGLTPPNYSSPERGALGWLDFIPLKEGYIDIPPLSESNVAYALATDRENEFYFFENRQQTGNDEYLPGHGMLVWHVDYDADAWRVGDVNIDEEHQNVDLVEADDKKTYETRPGDSFPGTEGVTDFGNSTEPRLASWSGANPGLDLIDITESEEGIISFRAIESKSDPGSSDMIITDPAENITPIYDLQGRRISRPATGQPYIRNSKKHITGKTD